MKRRSFLGRVAVATAGAGLAPWNPESAAAASSWEAGPESGEPLHEFTTERFGSTVCLPLPNVERFNDPNIS